MQCSARKFLASQALYGAQIAHPDWTHEQLVAEAVALSALLIRVLERKGAKEKGRKGANGIPSAPFPLRPSAHQQ